MAQASQAFQSIPETGGDRFRAAFEHADIGMALVGLGPGTRGRCLTVNSALAGLLAMPRDELSGVPLADFMARDDREAWVDALTRLEEPGVAAVRVDVHLRARGGKDLDALVSASAASSDGARWRCAVVQVLPAA